MVEDSRFRRCAGLAFLAVAGACQPRPPPQVMTTVVVETATPTVPAAAPVPAPSPPRAPLPAHPVWVVLTEGGRHFLSIGTAPEAWAQGAPGWVGDERALTAVRSDVDAARTSAEQRRLVGQPVKLFDVEGKECPGRVLGLELLEQLYDVPEAVERRWASLDEAHRATDPALAAAARTAWAKSRGRRTLVARIEEASTCSEPLWAQPAEAPSPAVVPFGEAKGALVRAGSQALRALPVYRKIQAQFARRRKPGEPEQWSDLADYGESVSFARGPSGETLVLTGAAVCRGYTEFTFNVEVFWRLSGPEDAPVLTLFGTPAPSEERWVHAAADLDGDGRLDVITLDGFMLARADGMTEPEHTRGRLVYTCPGAGAAAASLK